ncbi:hypothetical protein DdX_17963 [Ditylenchus destructor]|uniref:Uncharacterized protein n=1 Tax=Ditylenchus destructor TaxID=166010 RepID=A0AAD4QYI4_9BILA|nr:hypothetical protein DdX_17963 [Ditylenchus destructor]
MLQSFWICFCVFLVAGAFASTGFFRIPDNLVKCATMALQIHVNSIFDVEQNNSPRCERSLDWQKRKCLTIYDRSAKMSQNWRNFSDTVGLSTMALQLCLGSTSIVYLTLNKTIRLGVKDLLTGKKGRVSGRRFIKRLIKGRNLQNYEMAVVNGG